MTKSKEFPSAVQITNALSGKLCGFCVPGIIEGGLKKMYCVLIDTLGSFSPPHQELGEASIWLCGSNVYSA